MTKLVSSLALATGRGVFGMFDREVAAAKAIKTGRCVMLCQLPWGPVGEITEFESPAIFRAKFAPAGFDRTVPAYNVATKFAWPDLNIIRVLADDAVKATINLQKAGPLDCVEVNAKHFGSGGNGISCVVAAASDGVANSFDLTISKTNATTGKSTVEKYKNVDSTQTAASYWTGVTANSVLVGPLVKSAVGRPANGTYTLATGSDGSAIVAADYIGTPGSPDVGLSLCEKDPDIDFIFCGENPGDGIRATVNSGLTAHKTLMNDQREVLYFGAKDESDATAKTNAALHQDEGVYYVTGFGQVVDEDATSDSTPMIEIPLAAALAGFASTIQPHVSPAIKRRELTKYFAPIKGLTNGTGSAQSLESLEDNGVIAFEKNSDGTFSPYCGVCTDKSTPMFVARMRRFIMFSIGDALEDYRNSPNDDQTQEDERTIAKDFLDELVLNGKKGDIISKVCVKAAGLLPEEAANTTASEAAGDYTIPFEVQLFSEQKRIILKGLIGTTVTVTVAA